MYTSIPLVVAGHMVKSNINRAGKCTLLRRDKEQIIQVVTANKFKTARGPTYCRKTSGWKEKLLLINDMSVYIEHLKELEVGYSGQG